jgi:hypothetical protein
MYLRLSGQYVILLTYPTSPPPFINNKDALVISVSLLTEKERNEGSWLDHESLI